MMIGRNVWAKVLLMLQNFIQANSGSIGSRIQLSFTIFDRKENLLIPINKLH
jgi:hypothetical protein